MEDKVIQKKIDSRMIIFMHELKKAQLDYFSKHGKYFQLLNCPENTILDGNSAVFTVINPSDEKKTEDIKFSYTSPIFCQVQIDEWVNRDNAGYEIISVMETSKGDKYRKVYNSRDESSKWHKLLDPNTL